MARSDKTGMLIGAGFALGLAVLERVRPLRRRTAEQAPRTLHNLAMGIGSALVVQFIEEPLVRRIARSNARKERGLVRRLPVPLRLAGILLVMDYTFYLWHVATHKVSFLWRFHRVHHSDPDLDASTAIRFHAADMVISLPWRLVQVRLSGAGERDIAIWRHYFNASILFHHANLRLSDAAEQRLSRVLTTPRMHGIHHSQAVAERESNWSSGFSLWDHLHGTYRDTPAQEEIDIGVDDAEPEDAASIPHNLVAPFR